MIFVGAPWFCLINTQIIIATVTKQKLNFAHWTSVPFFILLLALPLNSLYLSLDEKLLVGVLFGMNLVTYLHYVFSATS